LDEGVVSDGVWQILGWGKSALWYTCCEKSLRTGLLLISCRAAVRQTPFDWGATAPLWYLPAPILLLSLWWCILLWSLYYCYHYNDEQTPFDWGATATEELFDYHYHYH
jgi:hypothetical protein